MSQFQLRLPPTPQAFHTLANTCGDTAVQFLVESNARGQNARLGRDQVKSRGSPGMIAVILTFYVRVNSKYY